MIKSKFIIKVLTESLESPSELADQILKRYKSEDFKSVINDIAEKNNLSRLRLIRIFCDQTGTDTSNLPGGYSLNDFVKKPIIKKTDGKPLPPLQIDVSPELL